MRAVLVIIGALPATAAATVLFASVWLVQGYTVPPRVYLFLAGRLPYRDVDPAAAATLGPLLSPRPSAEAMRDFTFEVYNVKPAARDRLRGLPVAYAAAGELWGAYDPNTGQITIVQHYLPVLLHEYAHADFDGKPLPEKLGFLFALLRLRARHGDRAGWAKAIVVAELATAGKRAGFGESYSPALESYAHLAELSGGDLSAMPELLQPYYADFLQPGPNRWTSGTATSPGWYPR